MKNGSKIILKIRHKYSTCLLLSSRCIFIWPNSNVIVSTALYFEKFDFITRMQISAHNVPNSMKLQGKSEVSKICLGGADLGLFL